MDTGFSRAERLRLLCFPLWVMTKSECSPTALLIDSTVPGSPLCGRYFDI